MNKLKKFTKLDNMYEKTSKNNKNIIEIGKKSCFKNNLLNKKSRKDKSKNNKLKLNFSLEKQLENEETTRNEKHITLITRDQNLFNFSLRKEIGKKEKLACSNGDKEISLKNSKLYNTEKISNGCSTESRENSLHENISNYITSISPSESDNQKRHLTIDLLKLFFQKFYPSYIMEVFGSFPQDLHLKDSDIDIVISKSRNSIYKDQHNFYEEKKLLLSIRSTMVRHGFSLYENTLFIDATVPIVKAICEKTNINIDIRLI